MSYAGSNDETAAEGRPWWDEDPHADSGAPPPVPAPVADSIAGVRRRLDPLHVSASRISGTITALVFFATAVVGLSVVWLVTDFDRTARVSITVAALAVVVLTAVFAYAWPPLEYARTTWRVSPEGLEIKRGVWWRRVVNVPLSRIQHTDVVQGPLQRRFGLATLAVHTAGTHSSEVNLVGVSQATALAARDYLLDSDTVDDA